ncbi:MAG: hypothetical protein IRZ14_08570 [Chloroflexi bacterium]|nr:hypothetical protein [Chloroflexota bacterium]
MAGHREAERPLSAAAPPLRDAHHAFPAAEARATRTPEEAQRLAWRVLTVAFGVWLVLAIGTAVGAVQWFHTATVAAPATLYLTQGIVLFREREGAPLQPARDAMPIFEGDTLEVTDNALATLALPGTGTLYLGPGVRLRVRDLRAGRFNPEVARVGFQQTAGAVRFEIVADTARPPSVETPYGTVTMGPGDYVVAVQGRTALALARRGEARVSVGADIHPLRADQRIHLAAGAPAEGPYDGAPNLVRNGDFSDGLAGWQPHDELERTPRLDRGGQREIVTTDVGGQLTTALRVSRQSLLQTHNETGVMQTIHADVAVYPEVRLSALIRVRQASLSGGGYLGTEYPAMLRLHYRDAAGNGRTWVHGFYYQNPEERPVERGSQIPRDTWVRFEVDLAELQPRPITIYALEVLGAGHDFDALITDVQLVAR